MSYKMKDSTFDQFAQKFAVQFPLTRLGEGLGDGRPVRIGIDAEHFLLKFAGKEPLNGALGGDPLSLEDKLMVELREIQNLNCQIIFYFHGCTYGPYVEPFTAASLAADNNSKAFTKYEEAMPKEAIEIFKSNDFSDRAPVLQWLKTVLGKHEIPFLVAPFSAYAQMVDAFTQNAIDAYYASTEIFLYGAGQIIWSVDMKVENQKSVNAEGVEIAMPVANVKESSIRILDWESLSPAAGTQSPANEITIKDAMILSGSTELPTYPPLNDLPFQQVVDRINYAGVEAVVQNANNLDSKAKSEYWEKFMATSASIAHMVILNHINETAPRTGANAPGDLQLALAVRLPDELSYYMSTGLISPRVLNWMVTHKIPITAPFDGGDQLYRKVIRDTLNPIRQQAYGLLATTMARYFQHSTNSTEYWFGASKQEFKGNEIPISQPGLSSWRVREKGIAEKAAELNTPTVGLTFAIRSLNDSKFPPKTMTRKEKDPSKWDTDPLTSENELVDNATWRMLMLRGYVNKEHELTQWGKIAHATLQVAGSSKEQSEAAFVAVEMLRAGHFSPKELLSDHENDDLNRQYTWLVSKVLTVGQMAHLNKGYSGPLSRRLLAFHASVSAMRTTLRDLTEASLANLFLCGDGERVRDDYVQLAKDLPFQGRFSCGLSIVISTYLDEYHTRATAASLPDINNKLQQLVQQYCAHTLVGPSLERAVNLWDAFMAGVRASGDFVSEEDKAKFEEVNKWFAGRRPGTENPVVPNGE